MQVMSVASHPAIKRDHIRLDGKYLTDYVATVPDGILKITVGFEPGGKGSRFIWHASFSIINLDGGNFKVKFRRPTKKEVKRALKEIMPEIRMRLENTGSDPMVVNAWQVE